MKTIKLGFVVLSILVWSSGCSPMRYSLTEAYQRIDSTDASVLVTREFGSIQYSRRGSSGTPVLIVHGIVGGFDQGLQTGINLLPEDRRMLSVSRFGYLGSTLPEEHSPLAQSRAYVTLLDHLGIESVYLLATSAGGTLALSFALHFPERTSGLIMVGAGYPDPNPGKGPSGPPAFIYSDWVFQFMMNRMEGMLLDMFGVTKEEFSSASEPERKRLRSLLRLLLPIKPRKSGIWVDQNYINPYMNAHYDDYPLESIEAPVLILHAKNDPMAKYEVMKQASGRFPNATVVVYETGGHVLFGHDEENRRHIHAFLTE